MRNLNTTLPAAKDTQSEKLQQSSDVNSTGGYVVESTSVSDQLNVQQTEPAKPGKCNTMDHTE